LFLRKKYTTDQEIQGGLLKGNSRAQEAVYKKYSGLLLGLCLRYVSDRDLAEECLSNGFLKVFDKIETKDVDKPLKPWMSKIMVNECLQAIRKKKADFLFIDDIDEGSISELETEDLDVSHIFEAIKDLPSGYRTIFNLYAVEGYKHQEIAEKLNISLGTSKSQYARAKSLLITKINGKEKVKEVES
jgi:RNA polymerase sigma-70 factor (ECF subfamily)